MHQARSEAAPRMDDAFVIVDSSLSIQAVSRAAETILGAREHEVVNRHVTELLLPADSEPDAAASLAPAITRAAGGEEGPTTVFVRPGATFGVRLSARIAPCGPPRAALVVLE
jgi:PAS domain S-box-containing protein